MTYIKEIIIILLIGFSAYAQDSYKYMGVIRIQDSLVITYKLEFSESNGKISGFSLTDFGGDHETKSKLAGTYDNENKILEFKEVAMVYTKSSFSSLDFCNIHFLPSRFRLGSDKLMGEFKGKFSDGTECINGEIAMNSVEKIDKRMTKFAKKINKSKRVPDSLKQKMNNIKLLDTLNLNVLKKGEVTSVLTRSESVSLFIYDGGQIDNDIITIMLDGKALLTKHVISENKKRIDIPMNKDVVKLVVHSDSEGTIGSNTAIIEIHDSDNQIKTMTNLKKGEVTKIDLIKKR